MNDRIRKIAIETDAWCDRYYFGELSYQHEWGKKFAELIIQECARIARATPCPYDDEEIKQVFGHTWDIAALAAGRSIKDYFGVRR